MAFCHPSEVLSGNDAVREYGCEFIYRFRTDKPTPAEHAAAREAQTERLEHQKKVKAEARKKRDARKKAEGLAELKKPLKKKTKKNKKKEKKAEQKVDQPSDAISAIL